MKKFKKIHVVSTREDENFEVYILYPENAVSYINHKKQNISAEDAPKIKDPRNPLNTKRHPRSQTNNSTVTSIKLQSRNNT